jgi:uncharacterized membrane protein YczE
MTFDAYEFLYDAFLSLEPYGYLGPLGLVVIGYILIRKEVVLGILWFIVECLFIGQYLSLVETTPDYWWHILILLLGGLFTCVYPLWDRKRS